MIAFPPERFVVYARDLDLEAQDAELARAILDSIAVEPGQTLTELLEGLPGQPARTQLSDLLRDLIDDFYIVREASKHDFI